MRQFHYRFMELEPVAEEDEPQSLPQMAPSQQQAEAAGPRASLWRDFDEQTEIDASCERLQRLEDEVAELRELNELLEFRLLEMENAETPGSSTRCCCGTVCTRASADGIMEKTGPAAAGRIVATVLPFTTELTDADERAASPPPPTAMRPKLSDSSHESGIFDSDSDASYSDARRDVDDIDDTDDEHHNRRRYDDDEEEVDDGCDAGPPATPPRVPARRRRGRQDPACKLTQVTQTEPPCLPELLSQAVQTEPLSGGCNSCASQTECEPVGCSALSGEIQKLDLIREHMEQRAMLEQRCQQLESRRQEEQQLLGLWLPAALAWLLWRAAHGQKMVTSCLALQQCQQAECAQPLQLSVAPTAQDTVPDATVNDCGCCERLQAEHEEVMRRADEVWSELEVEHEQQLLQRDQLLHQREQQLQDAEKRLREVEQQLRHAEDDREALRAERLRLRRQVSQLLEAVSAADLSLQQLQAEVDDVLRPELAREKLACQQLQESMHEAIAAAELRFQNEVNESNSKLQQVTNDLNEINCECEQLREEVETLEATVKELREEIKLQKEHEKTTTLALNKHILSLEQMLNKKESSMMCEKTSQYETEEQETNIPMETQMKFDENLEEQTSRIINGTFPNLEGPIDELTKVVRSLDDTLEYIKEIKEPEEDKSSVRETHISPTKNKPEVPPKKFLLGNHLLSSAKRNIMFWNDISCSKTSKNLQPWSFANNTLGHSQEKQLVQQK